MNTYIAPQDFLRSLMGQETASLLGNIGTLSSQANSGDTQISVSPATASPVSQISGLIGPVYIIQGTGDTTVTQANSQELYGKLQQYGSDVTYVSYIGGHEFTGITQAQLDTLQMGAIQFIQGQFPVS